MMELLKEVANDRLVVMVTHNPELAQQYATRIVTLKDGKIRADSNPYDCSEESGAEPVHKNMGKASMSFLTALSLSFNNLRTKKARTLLTSFAGFIGIIGIALILAISNGVNAYINTLEEDTLSEYPLQIQSSTMDLGSMMAGAGGNSEEEVSGEVQVSQMLGNMFSRVDPNDLESLKEYLDSKESGIEQYTTAVEYSYDVSPQIFREDEGEIRQVNPDRSFAALGIGGGSDSFMSSMMSTDVFYQMPADAELYADQYVVKAGRWPENYNECVVVLTSGGKISDFMLYTLGLRDSLELDEMIQQFLADEEVDTPEDIRAYSYDELLGITFKLVNAADYYEYDENYALWTDRTGDEAYMRELVENGEDIRIVGVVQPAEDASAAMLDSGIAYPASLTEYVAEKAAGSRIVQEQQEKREINVLTGNTFGEDNRENRFDMESLFSVNEDALREAFQFNTDAVDMDMSEYFSMGGSAADLSGMIDPGSISLEIPELPGLNMGDIIGDMNLSVSRESLQELMKGLTDEYGDYAAAHPEADYSNLKEYFRNFLQTPETKQYLEEKIPAALGSYMKNAMASYTGALSEAVQTQITSAVGQMMNQMADNMQAAMQQVMADMGAGMAEAFEIDAEAFADAIEMNMSETELTDLLSSLMSAEDASYDNNLKNFGYADLENPGQISIYPKDFESKAAVVDILDSYNRRMEAEGSEDKIISYTDMVGTLMSSVTEIVDTISYVLVAFVAISLVVSSIMIGVITYISVLERRKEIGILRAIGASRGNVSQVFNAETFIIGLCAGLIGIGLTQFLLIPGNALIHSLAGTTDINASLPAVYGIVLIALSVILTLIGGLIPSAKAAKSDPVKALRSE